MATPGGSPLYSTSLLVFDGLLRMTQRVSCLVYLGDVVGLKLYPMAIGFVIEDYPARR